MPDTIAHPAAPAVPASPSPAAPAAAEPFGGLRPPAGSEVFAEIDAMGVEDGKPEPPRPIRGNDGKFQSRPATPAPEKAAEPPKPEKPAEKPAAEKPADKPVDKPAEVPAEKMAPKQLREAYEAIKAKHKTLEAEHLALKTKAATPVEDPEKKTLAERLAEREKRVQEVEEKLRYAAYTESEDYETKFHKPFIDAYMVARAKVASLKLVQQIDPDTGDIKEPPRQGTAEDFDALMRITDDDAAADWAAEKFGHKAPIVLNQRAKVQELNEARTKAIENYRKDGAAIEKTRSEQLAAFRQKFTETVDTHAKAAVEKYPHWFAPDEADPKGNEDLERGQHLVARVVANGAPVKEGDAPMGPEELASAVAAIRQKAGAFDRLAKRHSAANARIKELETELSQYRDSKPGASDGKGTAQVADPESMDAALNLLEKEYSKEG